VDPELDGYLAELIAGVGRQVRRVLDVSRERGWLRDDVPFDELVEAFCVVTSVESYVRFVLVDRRPVEAYRDFVARTVAETIFRA
jgi:hypothetical protein